MALPSPIVVQMAKGYAFALELGRTAADARAMLRRKYPAATASQIRSAIDQANVAIQTGRDLAHLNTTDELRKALAGGREPSPRVGVRVKITMTFTSGKVIINDVYLDMAWSDTIADVDAAVLAYAESVRSQSAGGRRVTTTYDFAGPTRWPAHYP